MDGTQDTITIVQSDVAPLTDQTELTTEAARSDKVAICLHAYYYDVAKDVIKAILNNRYPFDLYVTCDPDRREGICEVLYEAAIPFTLLIVNNIGMDVYPFLFASKSFALHEYLAVVKLHTKSNLHTLGAALGTLMLRRVIGNSTTTADLVELYRSRPDLLLAGPNDTFRHLDYMLYNNRAIYLKICDDLGFARKSEIGFFAGTFFWIRGSALACFYDQLDLIQSGLQAERSDLFRTGGDGTIAHALERIWLASAQDDDPTVALIYQKDIEDTQNVLRIARQSEFLQEPHRRIGVSDIVTVWMNATMNARSIEKSLLFDAPFYGTQLSDCPNPGISPHLHFVLYGETLGKDPSAVFDTTFYRLNRPDVVRKGVNVLTHYINSGHRENVTIQPTIDDWISLAKRYSLFDNDFYRREHGAVVDLFDNPCEHYKLVGVLNKLATSVNFDPKNIPLFDEVDPREVGGVDLFLKRDFERELMAHNEIIRIVENNDFAILGKVTDEARRTLGETAAVRIARILHLAEANDWEAAGVLLEDFWDGIADGRLTSRHIHRLTSWVAQKNDRSFDVVATAGDVDVDVPICVYTTLFGDGDVLPPNMSAHAGNIDFICFTDKERSAHNWRFIVVDPGQTDSNLNAKALKVNPFEALANYRYSLFVDANTMLCGRLDFLIRRFLVGHELVMWAHPERDDVFTEAIAIVEHRRHPPAQLVRQLTAYQKQGVPRHSGLYEASFIWRDHESQSVRYLMTEWWDHILTYSKRDQLSLAYLVWKTGIRPQTLPASLGNSRENKIFVKLPHLSVSDASFGSDVPRLSPLHRQDADIWVLYGAKYVNSGSTVLRGQQLSELIKRCLPTRNVFYSSYCDIANAVVIVNKSCITEHGDDIVARLKSRNNIVLLDLVDARPSRSVAETADGLIASSLGAFRSYRTNWPHKRAFHITHHVDTRMPVPREPATTLAMGYIGELVNTTIPAAVADDITPVGVDTSSASIAWMDGIAQFNCHYAVRQQRAIDGHKPFLKGFVAAFYGSNIIIQEDAGDASYYLGPDYPYLLRRHMTENDLVEMIGFVKESFGGKDWLYGLEIMDEVRRRSSIAFVLDEITAMFKEIDRS